MSDSSPTKVYVPQAGIDYPGVTTPIYCHNGRGKLLLQLRSGTCRDNPGRWDVGSGVLDLRKGGRCLTLEENALEEAKEEYNIDGEVTGVLPAQSIIMKWPVRIHHEDPDSEVEEREVHWIAVPHFILVKNPSEVRIMEKNKATECRWFYAADLPQPLHIGFEETYRQHSKAIIYAARLEYRTSPSTRDGRGVPGYAVFIK